ncbi:MAG TPA: glycosyltransferase [Gemmataceae bacterium]|nr:glycosyltransferase [Gemmataceae bacterium]
MADEKGHGTMTMLESALRRDWAAVQEPTGGLAPAARLTDNRVRVDGKRLTRGGAGFRIQGVTYGPFAPGPDGIHLPNSDRIADDFARMRSVEVNALRTYHLPPGWFLETAAENELSVFIDVPWPKHLCFLDSRRIQAEALATVTRAAKQCVGHESVLALSVGNEIPTDVVRWHGVRRVERFLAELADSVKQVDPDRLVTFASFPPTEYLDLPFLDFVTFNVYLHDRAAFRRYLFRLQNLAGDRPLILGELGMDTLRHGELAQAEFLAGHVAEARLMGLAGSFVFAWTDEWHTGGHPITDWAFGVTSADRTPKAACHALSEVYEQSPAALLPTTPRVSVVVCTYNGGKTLDQCLQSLAAVEYPDYEVIVVDDGSTDDTGDILARFPEIKAIRQPNRGLSVARNVGLAEASGEIVAYTDSDCFADPDWLTHLVYQLHRSGAHGVGGPNLTPDDGWLAACVAASPGQPTHVLESDQVAEHVPGCNMAFRRESLLAINGFDPVYRKAGDDVDLCWRLQQAGMWITFAPGAFVWHHRRQGPRAFLKQQGGYGEAEGLLAFKHPDKFNARGESRWRGVMYGGSLHGVRLSRPVVYHGTFATGLFQCVYQPGPAHWATVPATLEWHLVAGLVALVGIGWWPLLAIAGLMLLLSFVVAFALAAQARLPTRYDGWTARIVVAALCYAQPLVRSWKRYRVWALAFPCPSRPDACEGEGTPLPFGGRFEVAYWTETWADRSELLTRAAAYLAEHQWGRAIDSGWAKWDLELSGDRWTLLQIRTVQEEHGGGRRLIRVAYRLRRRGTFAIAAMTGMAATALTALAEPLLAVGPALVTTGFLAYIWWRGRRLAGRAAQVIEVVARGMNLVPTPARRSEQ